jgi:hypothetical protein
MPSSLVLFLLLGVACLLVVFLGAFRFLSRIIKWELAWDWRLLHFGAHLFGLGLIMGALSCLLVLAHFGHLH